MIFVTRPRDLDPAALGSHHLAHDGASVAAAAHRPERQAALHPGGGRSAA
jgi:hypothetical protein